MTEKQIDKWLRTAKPCPFCGERLVNNNDHHGFWAEHRGNSKCFLRFYQILDQEDASGWNSRTP
jgi:hypothetical protein